MSISVRKHLVIILLRVCTWKGDFFYWVIPFDVSPPWVLFIFKCIIICLMIYQQLFNAFCCHFHLLAMLWDFHIKQHCTK